MPIKKALSISLGTPQRDKRVEIPLLGETVCLERIGTNGDEKRARQMYNELDGSVDAFGVGGIALYLNLPWKRYPLYAGLKLVQDVKLTPYTDGKGLQTVLESRVMQIAEARIGSYVKNKKAFMVEAISRYGMLTSFLKAGYECVYGDLMFALSLPLAIRSLKGLHRAARILLPVVGHFPISMLYSTGESQEENVPKYERYYQEATVIAGDCLYIKKHMPEDMDGKIIVTNTTTPEDTEFMRKRGIKFLITTTPVLQGRSFGTNAFEAALVAAAGKGRILSDEELALILDEVGIEPTIQELN